MIIHVAILLKKNIYIVYNPFFQPTLRNEFFFYTCVKKSLYITDTRLMKMRDYKFGSDVLQVKIIYNNILTRIGLGGPFHILNY